VLKPSGFSHSKILAEMNKYLTGNLLFTVQKPIAYFFKDIRVRKLEFELLSIA
jgi:hypothetical protein